MDSIPPMKAKKLSSAGYVFRKDRENEKTQKTTWRCARRGCTGRAYTQWCEREQRMAVHHTQAHTHGPDPNVPDSVEWVECSEVRRTAPIAFSQEEPWERPRVDAATQLSAPGGSGGENATDTAPKRKHHEEPDVDIDFDVDLNVHFDVGGQHSSSSFHSMPGTSTGSLQQTTKGKSFHR